MPEQKEAWMRLVVGLVSGIILEAWKILVIVLAIFQFFYILFTKKRRKDIADLCNLWVTEAYRFLRYMTFTTNSRPFPFSDLGKVQQPVEIKK